MANGNDDQINLDLKVKNEDGGRVIEEVTKQLADLRAEMKATTQQAQDTSRAFSSFGSDSERLESRLKTLDQITNAWKDAGKNAQSIAYGIVDGLKAQGLMAGATADQMNRLLQAQIKMGALKPVGDFATPVTSEGTKQMTAAVAGLDSQINMAIGSVQRLGQLVDVTSAEAVAAFRAEAEAIKGGLINMGAQEQELGRIDTAIGRAEIEMGKFQASMANGAVGMDRMGVQARRGANAVATLATGMVAGGVSARTLSIGMGSAVAAIADFSDNAKVAASASGIGALITVLAVVIDLFYKLNHEEEKTKSTLAGLGNLRASQLEQLQKTNEANLKGAQQRSAQLSDQVAEEGNSLNIIKNITAVFHTFQARKAQAHYADLLALREELTKALVEQEHKEAQQVYEAARDEQNKAMQAAVDRTQGPSAARKIEAKNELEVQLENLKKLEGNDADHARLEQAYRKQYSEKILAIDRDQAQKERELFEKLQGERLTAQDKANEDEFQKQLDVLQRQSTAAREAIERDRDLLNKPGKKQEAISLVNQRQAAEEIAIEKDRSNRIAEIREEAANKLATINEQGINEDKIRGDYKKSLKLLADTIASTHTSEAQKEAARQGQALIEALIPEEVAKSRIDAIEKALQEKLDAGAQDLQRINVLQESHAISELQAQDQILATMKRQRDAVAESIPELERQAALLPGNQTEQKKLADYKEKLFELNLSISQLSDNFFKFKMTGIEASTAALENFFKAIPEWLAGQGQKNANVKDLQDHLAAANEELGNLLANPHPTSDTAQQIASVRKEIVDTNNALRQSKSEIVTWKTMMLDAARSVASALLDVASHMLAVYLIQQALGFLNFGGGGNGSASVLAAGAQVVTGGKSGLPKFAAGGPVSGPGSGVDDRIPAWLSNGEYIMTAQATARLGTQFLDALNYLGSPPTPRAAGRYAVGGVVDAEPSRGGFEAQLGLEPGLVVSHMKTREGTQVILDVLGSKRRAIRSILGL
jgi:hypothetical protein